ncbi:MAG: hypothetical protein WAU36_15095 [Cyclobacteriaceae bacterium]
MIVCKYTSPYSVHGRNKLSCSQQLNYTDNKDSHPDELVRGPGKIARVRWHEGGSIILPSVFAYFLGNAKSMSHSGLSYNIIWNSINAIKAHIALDNDQMNTALI